MGENERVSQEKKRLQNQADGVVDVDEEERDKLLAEATALKEELLKSSTADGKVPPHLMERMQHIQRRLAEMGLATGQKAAAIKQGIAEAKGTAELGSLRHLWNRLVPIFALAVIFAVLGVLVWHLTGSSDGVGKKAKKKHK